MVFGVETGEGGREKRTNTASCSLYLPRDIFSPDSGGRVKVRRAVDEMRTQGMMRLNP